MISSDASQQQAFSKEAVMLEVNCPDCVKTPGLYQPMEGPPSITQCPRCRGSARVPVKIVDGPTDGRYTLHICGEGCEPLEVYADANDPEVQRAMAICPTVPPDRRS